MAVINSDGLKPSSSQMRVSRKASSCASARRARVLSQRAGARCNRWSWGNPTKNSFKFGHLLSQIMFMTAWNLTKLILVKQQGPFHVELAFQEVSCHFSFCLPFKQPGALFIEISRFPMLHLLGSHVGKLITSPILTSSSLCLLWTLVISYALEALW